MGLSCSLLLLAAAGFSSAKPVVIWESEPVRPGEVVVLRGEDFGADLIVEVAPVSNGHVDASSVWKEARVLQQTAQTLKFELPQGIDAGLIRYRLTGNGVVEGVLNEPQVWWMQGDRTETASPGGWLRLFGTSLDLESGAKVILDGEGGRWDKGVEGGPSDILIKGAILENVDTSYSASALNAAVIK